ncbi:TolC family protein [Nautilia lithotrophica]
MFGNNLLNDLKQQELNYDKQQTFQESKDTEKSWINPIILKYTYSKDNTLGDIKTTNKTFSISVNQPIFKSGAIYYSIKYAKHSKSFNVLNIELKKRELIKQALDLAYDYKIAKLSQKIILLNISNTKIDIQKKKEEFLNGVGDSTLLNNAILQLNNLKLNLEDIKSNLNNLKYSFKNISSLNIENVKLPFFKLISKDKYINSNLEFLAQKKLKKVKYDLYKMQLGNQLLSVNINGSLNWQNIDYSQNTIQFQDSKNDYYRFGFSITLPISFNAVNKIQQTKIDYLKSQTMIEDKRLVLNNLYQNTISQIKTLDKKIKIYKENIKIYDDLITSTLDSIQAGNATELDLKILQNSRKTSIINIEILKLKKQKLLLSLYYKLSNWDYK